MKKSNLQQDEKLEPLASVVESLPPQVMNAIEPILMSENTESFLRVLKRLYSQLGIFIDKLEEKVESEKKDLEG